VDRTVRAALVAMIIVAGTVGGLGAFLGFDAVAAILVGIVLGLLAALLLWGASRRADTFHPTDPTAHLADHSRPAQDPRRSDDHTDTPDRVADDDHRDDGDTTPGA